MKTINKNIVSDRSYYFLLDFNEKDEWRTISEKFGVTKLRELEKPQYEELLRYAFEKELEYFS